MSSGMWDFWEKMESRSDIEVEQRWRRGGLKTMEMKLELEEASPGFFSGT